MASRRPEAGQEIDGFTLVERLHQGPMSTLWRATQAGRAEPVILKIPALAEGDDVSSIVGFEVEQMSDWAALIRDNPDQAKESRDYARGYRVTARCRAVD